MQRRRNRMLREVIVISRAEDLRFGTSQCCAHLKPLVWKKYRYRFAELSTGITQLLQTPYATTGSLTPTVKSIELGERRSNFRELNRKSGTARKGQKYGS